MYMYAAVYEHAQMPSGPCGHQKMVSDPLEELQAVVNS